MDLSLNGSQICLATREKQQQAHAAINYPQLSRPASASHGCQRTKFPSRNRHRPLSADSRFVKRNLCSKIGFGERKVNSSSNIFSLVANEVKNHLKREISPSKMQPEKDNAQNCSENKEINKNLTQTLRPNFNLRRPDTLNLSMDYGATSGTKLLKNGKKSLSYDLWVNENVNKASESAKKADLAGRVSFSSNDVYEIFDYSDVDTESSHADSTVHKTDSNHPDNKLSSFKSDQFDFQPHSKPYIKEHFMESNSDNEIDEFRQKSIKASEENEVQKMNNLKSKENSANRMSDFSNPVIKNYLKAKEQEISSTATRKFNDLSKKPKNFQDLVKTKLNNAQSFSTPKSAPPKTNRVGFEKPKKPHSANAKGQNYNRQDSTLNEFQIEKVVSWMTVNDDNFESEFEYSVAGPENDEKLTMVKEETSYREITDFIKEIEHDRNDSEDFKALKTDVEFKLNTILNSIESISSSDEKSPLTEANEMGKMSSLSTRDEIFTYLDKVDSSCDKALIQAKSGGLERENMELEFALEPDDVIENIPKIADLLVLPNHQLARRIVSLSLRANELSNAIQLSKEHVSNVRSDKAKAVRLEKLATQNKLKEQKKHYEEITRRHQVFIEQLIKDKAALCEKVSQITRRIDSQNQAWEHRLKTEVERVKETAMAGEKIRRQKWVSENTKKIKELTVKGLEMEINKMTATHKHEIEELKRQNQLDILQAIEETKEKCEKSEKFVRETYAAEREQAIERERKAIRERYEKQVEDERKSAEQQRARMVHDFEVEKDRLYSELREKEHQFEMKKEELMNEKMEVVEEIKESYKEKLKQRENKHQMEMSKVQEQYESDFKIWKRDFESKMKLRESERENSIREQYRLERDRQIDAIVNKVDNETLKSQQELEGKLSRMKEKYENEILHLETSEKSLKDKYMDSRTRLAESEANNQNLKSIVTQMELQLNHSTKLCEKFTAEKDNLREDARNEVKNELESITKNHEMEIQRIYSRVQQAIQKKEVQIELLQKECVSLRERNLKLDAIIRQQRKDYCTK